MLGDSGPPSSGQQRGQRTFGSGTRFWGPASSEEGRLQRRLGQFSWQGLSLGFGCFGIHLERVEELAGCGCGWGSRQGMEGCRG